MEMRLSNGKQAHKAQREAEEGLLKESEEARRGREQKEKRKRERAMLACPLHLVPWNPTAGVYPPRTIREQEGDFGLNV